MLSKSSASPRFILLYHVHQIDFARSFSLSFMWFTWYYAWSTLPCFEMINQETHLLSFMRKWHCQDCRQVTPNHHHNFAWCLGNDPQCAWCRSWRSLLAHPRYQPWSDTTHLGQSTRWEIIRRHCINSVHTHMSSQVMIYWAFHGTARISRMMDMVIWPDSCRSFWGPGSWCLHILRGHTTDFESPCPDFELAARRALRRSDSNCPPVTAPNLSKCNVIGHSHPFMKTF